MGGDITGTLRQALLHIQEAWREDHFGWVEPVPERYRVAAGELLQQQHRV